MEGTEPNEEDDIRQRIQKMENDIGWALFSAEKNDSEWSRIMGKLGMEKSPYDLRAEDLLGKSFLTLEEAEYFFTTYARAIGFGVRKGHTKKNVVGMIRSRTWLCSKEGFRNAKFFDLPDRQKAPKLLTREGCHAMFRVNALRDLGTWKVSKFTTEHSHPLASATDIQFINSHRKVNGGALATAKAMHSAGIRKTHIMGFMASQAGGYNNVQFDVKDLYNKMKPKSGPEINDSHAAAAIGFLHHKYTLDPDFYGKYSVDGDNRLENLFWADSRSRQAYQTFGHTMAFDTTYKCNMYGKPLLVFVGINSHFHTTIFGFCLLVNETTNAYLWALSNFLECMDGSKPSTVVTDGDLAMKSAIKTLMPGTIHRLCTLHLMQNVTTNVKDPVFATEFAKLMKRHYSPETFDFEWHRLVRQFGLEESTWAYSLYEKRHSWAETYLRGNFFGGMKTTQRSEGMHAYLKANVKSSVTLLELVRSLDNAISWLRVKEAKEDYLSTSATPVCNQTNMAFIEQQIAASYTRRLFNKVVQEMKREGGYLVSNCSESIDVVTCHMKKYSTRKLVREVLFNREINSFHCSCYYYETAGIPCRHIFSAIKYLDINSLPESLICVRWTKNASQNVKTTGGLAHPWQRNHLDNEGRFGHLITKTTEISYLAALHPNSYKYALAEIEKLVHTLRGMGQTTQGNEASSVSGVKNPVDIENPKYAKSKGSGLCGKFGGKRKKCSNCHQCGHNKATCLLPIDYHQRRIHMDENAHDGNWTTSHFDPVAEHKSLSAEDYGQMKGNLNRPSKYNTTNTKSVNDLVTTFLIQPQPSLQGYRNPNKFSSSEGGVIGSSSVSICFDGKFAMPPIDDSEAAIDGNCEYKYQDCWWGKPY